MPKFVKGGPNPGKKWQKGQSGNPGGRPKSIIEVASLAREQSSAAVELLTEVMNNLEAPTNVRVKAAIALLDRGCGRPAQAIDLIKRDLSMSEYRLLSDAELTAIVTGGSVTNGEADGSADAAQPSPDTNELH